MMGIEGRIIEALEKWTRLQQRREEESHSLSLLSTHEFGWNDITVYPAKRQYTSSCCYGGPPTYYEICEYDLRPANLPTHVFVKLIDWWKDDLSGTSYEVVNSTVCSCADDGLKNFDMRINWNELLAPEKYFILSIHGKDKDFFIKEQDRIQKGIAQIKVEAEALGAIMTGHDVPSYEAPPDANEEQKAVIEAALKALISEQYLKRYHISSGEVYDEQGYIHVLNRLASEA